MSGSDRRKGNWRKLAMWLGVVIPALGACSRGAVVNATDGPVVGKGAGPALGAHALLGEEDGMGVSLALTPPVATQPSGSALLAFYASYASNNQAPTDTYGNAWSLHGTRVVYEGYGGAFDARVFLALNGSGGAGHRLSIEKTGYPQGELTALFLEVTGANRLADAAQNYPQRGAPLRSGSVTTTGPALLVAIWAGDGLGLRHTAVPDSGFTVVDSFLSLPPNSAIQAAIAVKQVTTPGTFDVTWTETPDQGAILWLFAFQGSETLFGNGFE
jgi:hypothetical protein